MSYVIHPFTRKQVKMITEIYNTGTISTIDSTILSSKNKRYWVMPVSDVGLVLYDDKNSSHEVLIEASGKKFDTLGLRFVDGVLSFFGRTQIPNVFDRRKLSEYDLWVSEKHCYHNAPYRLELDSNGIFAIYDNNQDRVFPILHFK